MACEVIPSPIGPLMIETTAAGLRRLAFGESEKASRPGLSDESAAAQSWLASAIEQLDEYFDGERRSFDLPLDLEGSPFQVSIWRAIASISFGQTMSYADIAATAGFPTAFRAAGTACGANPTAIVVPCHRVISSGGGLGGFGGALHTKSWLLAREGVTLGQTSRLQQALPV